MPRIRCSFAPPPTRLTRRSSASLGGEETRSYPRDIERKRTPIRNYGPLRSLLTRADVFLAAARPPFFSSLVSYVFFIPYVLTFWSQLRENEWTLYPGLNLKHGRNGVRKARLARPGIISRSYRDAPTELLQKRLLTDGDKRDAR